MYVVVQFYPWFKFSFLLFLGMIMYDNNMIMSLKQKKRKFEPRIKLNYNMYRKVIMWPTIGKCPLIYCIQYCSKVSWQSLDTWFLILEPLKDRVSSLKNQVLSFSDRGSMIKFQISSWEILWTCRVHFLKLMYCSVILVCFSLNETHALKTKTLTYGLLLKVHLKLPFFRSEGKCVH